jgi:HSP20 family molecular chaperone IbpA
MGFFDDDPFDEIVREFFGGSPVRKSKQQFIRGEEEDRIIDFVEDENKIYLVFELPGYHEKDVSVKANGKILEISAKKINGENIQDYLNQKLRHGLMIKKQLPNSANPKKFSYTMRNGILEVIFEK